VHHGNGTQEIVEALIKPKEFIIKSNVSPFATCEIKSYQYKPWLDLDDGKNVLFTSIHLHGNTGGIFFPGTGSEDENTTDEDRVFPGGILNVPLTPGFATAQEWREAFTTKIFPRLMEF
jgi:acetoin utilization deacetylase AcuC-like enzyme